MAACSTCGIANFGHGGNYCIITKNDVFHAKCIDCEICKKPMSTVRKGIIKTYKYHVWHGTCCKCNACGATDAKEFWWNSLKNKVTHKKCPKALCRICAKPMENNDECIEYSPTMRLHNECYACIRPGKCGRCSSKMINPFGFFQKPWKPEYYSLFNSEVRNEIFTCLLIFRNIFPKDVLHYLFSFVATVDGRFKIAGVSGLEACTPKRCCRDIICTMCDSVNDWTSTKIQCTKDHCTTIQYICKECGAKVPHDSDKFQTCTSYRCINTKCEMCDGDLSPYLTLLKENKMCDKTHCLFYFQLRCSCGEKIQREPENPLEVCTVDRCKNEMCSTCGDSLSPFYDTERWRKYLLCTGLLCVTPVKTLINYYNNAILLLKLDTPSIVLDYVSTFDLDYVSDYNKWTVRIRKLRYEHSVASSHVQAITQLESMQIGQCILLMQDVCDDIMKNDMKKLLKNKYK